MKDFRAEIEELIAADKAGRDLLNYKIDDKLNTRIETLEEVLKLCY